MSATKTYDDRTNQANGGHVFNYYRVGGKYITFDYTSVDTGSIYANSTRCWITDSLEEIGQQILAVEQEPGFRMHTIFIERDVHRDRAAIGCGHDGKQGTFVDARHQNEIVLLYQDVAWQKSCPTFEYHPFFEQSVQISEADYPSWVFDGSSTQESEKLVYETYRPKSDGLVLCWGGRDVLPDMGFGVVRDGATAAVYWNGKKLTDYTFTVADPAKCTVTKDENGILTFTDVRDDTRLTINGPAGPAEFRIVTKYTK